MHFGSCILFYSLSFTYWELPGTRTVTKQGKSSLLQLSDDAFPFMFKLKWWEKCKARASVRLLFAADYGIITRSITTRLANALSGSLDSNSNVSDWERDDIIAEFRVNISKRAKLMGMRRDSVPVKWTVCCNNFSCCCSALFCSQHPLGSFSYLLIGFFRPRSSPEPSRATRRLWKWTAKLRSELEQESCDSSERKLGAASQWY